jgi:hypothetical protein
VSVSISTGGGGGGGTTGPPPTCSINTPVQSCTCAPPNVAIGLSSSQRCCPANHVIENNACAASCPTGKTADATTKVCNQNQQQPPPPQQPVCGNNIKEAGEFCDGTDTKPAECPDGSTQSIPCNLNCNGYTRDCILPETGGSGERFYDR